MSSIEKEMFERIECLYNLIFSASYESHGIQIKKSNFLKIIENNKKDYHKIQELENRIGKKSIEYLIKIFMFHCGLIEDHSGKNLVNIGLCFHRRS